MEIAVSLTDADLSRIADAVAARLATQPPPARSDAAAAGKLLWREDEAAEALGVSAAHLKKLRLRGYIQAATSDRPVFYRREHLEAASRFLTGSNTSARGD